MDLFEIFFETEFYQCQYRKDHCIDNYQFRPSPEFSMHSSCIRHIIVDLPAQRSCKLSVNKSLYAIKACLSGRKIIADINASQNKPYDNDH